MENLQVLDLHSTQVPNAILLDLLRAGPNLTQLDLGGCHLSDALGAQIGTLCPRLEAFGAAQAIYFGDVGCCWAGDGRGGGRHKQSTVGSPSPYTPDSRLRLLLDARLEASKPPLKSWRAISSFMG